MYRKIMHPESEDDLSIKLPDSYLNKDIEVIAFEVETYADDMKEQAAYFNDAEAFFARMSIDMSEFKFNREEANER